MIEIKYCQIERSSAVNMYFKTLLYLQRYTMTPRLLLVYSLEQMQLEAIGAKQKKMCGRSEFWW